MILGLNSNSDKADERSVFRVGLFGCPHSDKDIADTNRYPFTRAVEASIVSGRVCDVFHVLGDWTGLQSVTETAKTQAIARISADIDGAKAAQDAINAPWDLKSITGNHIGEPNSFDLYQRAVQDKIDTFTLPNSEVIDPNADYSWESYYYIEGNNLFFYMGDRNDIDAPWGKDGSTDGGGHPSGAIKFSTVQFFVETALKFPDYNIFVQTHQGPPNSTGGTQVGNGHFSHNDLPSAVADWKGTIGALYDTVLFSGGISQNDTFANELSGLVTAWFHSHTHLAVNDTHGGEDFDATINGTPVFNIGNLTQEHGFGVNPNQHPHGSILEFREGLDNAVLYKLIVEDHTLLGTSENVSHGDLYPDYTRAIQLKQPYQSSYTGSSPSTPSPVTGATRVGNTISWTGDADAYIVISSANPVTHNFTDDSAPYVPGYEASTGEIVRYIGKDSSVDIVTTDTNFRVVALNGGNGNINYSSVIDI